MRLPNPSLCFPRTEVRLPNPSLCFPRRKMRLPNPSLCFPKRKVRLPNLSLCLLKRTPCVDWKPRRGESEQPRVGNPGSWVSRSTLGA